jgi:hypothetical protein
MGLLNKTTSMVVLWWSVQDWIITELPENSQGKTQSTFHQGKTQSTFQWSTSYRFLTLPFLKINGERVLLKAC